MATPKVYDAFFEDNNADYMFYYTGKSNVLGLSAPDHVYRNKNKLRNIRLAYITVADINDPELSVIVNEAMKVVFIPETHNYSESIIQDVFDVKYHTLFKNNKLSDTVRLYSTCVNDPFYQFASFGDVVLAYSVETNVVDGIEKDALCIWAIGCENYEYICIHNERSLSATLAPINGESYFPSSYFIEFINDETAVIDTNVTDGAINGATLATDNELTLSERVGGLEESNKDERHLYKQTVVVYDAEYSPADTSEAILKPTSLKNSLCIYDYYDGVEEVVSSVSIDNVDKKIRVDYDGEYSIQLKNGFYLIRGESRVDINVYVGGDKDDELSMSMYLTSNNQEDARKAIKNTFCSPLKYAALTSGCAIEVRVSFTNIENIVVENETELIVTLLQRSNNIPCDE